MTYTGTSGDDSIVGSTGDDTILGLDGDDSLDGGPGNDSIDGGEGNNFIIGGIGNDTLIGGSGYDAFTNGVAFSYSDVSNGSYGTYKTINVNLAIDGGNDVIEGGGGTNEAWLVYTGRTTSIHLDNSNSAQVNTITDNGAPAGSIHNIQTIDIWTGSGDDYIRGGTPNPGAQNFFNGGAGNDTLIAGSSGDYLVGGDGNDSLQGGYGDYQQSTGGVTVDLRILTAQNTGSAGFDTLTAMTGLVGSIYTDNLHGDASANVLLDYDGGALGSDAPSIVSNDTVAGDAGDDVIQVYRYGTEAGTAVSLDGGDGDDRITFEAADSRYKVDHATISGGDGADIITPGGAVATITTGSGADLVQGTAADLGGDSITDFTVGDQLFITDGDATQTSFSGTTVTLGGGYSINLQAGITETVLIQAADDGVFVTLDPYSGDAGLVDGVFAVYAGRLPSDDDLTTNVAALENNQTTLNALRDSLVATPDGQARLPSVVTSFYEAYLGREPTSDELTTWTNAITSGSYDVQSAQQSFAAQAGAAQNETAEVKILFDTYLGRDPTADESAHWTSELASASATPQEVREALLFTSEGENYILTQVTALYESQLGRDPSDVELSYWANQIVLAGADYTTVSRAISQNLHLGTTGDDTLVASAGAEVFNGQSGNDTLVFAGFAHDYVLSLNGGAGTVTGGPEGANDTLASIENVQFQDGVLTFDPNSTAAQIVRLYDSFLGRAPDAAGFESYLRYVAEGHSFQDMADNAAASPEFANATAGLNDTQYVTYVYEHSLHREPDPTGLATYVADLENGTFTRTSMIVQAAESPEHVALTAGVVAAGLWVPNETVEGLELLYDAAVQRQPDPTGLAGYGEVIAQGETFRQVANQMSNSAEFLAAHANQTDAQYIDSLYVAEVGRHADPTGLADYEQQLQSGYTRGDILYETAFSQEHQAHVLAYYDPLLG